MEGRVKVPLHFKRKKPTEPQNAQASMVVYHSSLAAQEKTDLEQAIEILGVEGLNVLGLRVKGLGLRVKGLGFRI